MTPGADTGRAGLPRRLASAVYEVLLVIAILLVAGLAFLMVSPDAATSSVRPLFQLYLLGILGLYFTWFWTHGGQTLPMKAWGIKLVRSDGAPVAGRTAWLRFLLAWPAALLCGGGFLWALLDRDRQFLHDRLAGTRIVRAGIDSAARPF